MLEVDIETVEMVIEMPTTVMEVDMPVMEMVVHTGMGLPGADGGYVSPPLQSVIDGTGILLPDVNMLLCIVFEAAFFDRVVSVGTSPTATNVVDNEEIQAHNTHNILIFKSFNPGTTLYFSGITANVRLYIL